MRYCVDLNANGIDFIIVVVEYDILWLYDRFQDVKFRSQALKRYLNLCITFVRIQLLGLVVEL